MITNIYILICFIIFIYIQFINKEDKAYTAIRLGAFYPPHIKEDHEYYRFFTCHFIHIDFFHFFMNAYALYNLGRFFEQILGPFPYIYIILISMLLSSLLCYSASEIFERSYRTITFGASSVVYGFFGMIVVLVMFGGNFYANILDNMMPVIAINFIYTMINPQISKTGHLGGFIGGILGSVILMVMHIL